MDGAFFVAFTLDFLLHLTEQVRLCFWNDKDTSHKSE